MADDALLVWATDEGVMINGIAPAELPRSGRGVIAKEDITVRAVLQWQDRPIRYALLQWFHLTRVDRKANNSSTFHPHAC